MLWPRQRRTNRARRQLLRGDGRGANPRHVGPSRIDCARRPSGRLGQTPPYPTAPTGVITAPTGSSCTKAHADALGGSDNRRRTCGAHNRTRGRSGGSRPPTRTKPRPRRSSRSDPRALGCARTSHADQTAPAAIITIRPAGPRVCSDVPRGPNRAHGGHHDQTRGPSGSDLRRRTDRTHGGHHEPTRRRSGGIGRPTADSHARRSYHEQNAHADALGSAAPHVGHHEQSAGRCCWDRTIDGRLNRARGCHHVQMMGRPDVAADPR
jgi:hypothetical protein